MRFVHNYCVVSMTMSVRAILQVVLDEIMSEICWAVAFAVIGHAENAESFGLTLGGVAGLVSELRKPIPDGTGGENLMAACYALGNLAASHHSNQEIIMKNGGIERLLDLATKEMPAGVQRATCLAIAAVCGDKPECISRLLQYHKKDPVCRLVLSLSYPQYFVKCLATFAAVS
jgi:hypothetical protein